MSINVLVGDNAIKRNNNQLRDYKFSLDIRQTLGGDYVIYDHEDIDIVIMPKMKKVVAFPKDKISETTYDTESRLFDYLIRKGAILNGSVRSGNVYSSMQGFLMSDTEEKNKVDPHQVAIYLIAKFLRHELGEQDVVDSYQDAYEDLLTDPPDDKSTRLGKVPHQPTKGDAYRNTGNYFGLFGYGE